MIDFIIVTHGEFGAYLVEAAESIVGRQTAGVRVLSVSSRHGLAEMREKAAKAVEEMASADGLVVLTDLPAGTPVNMTFPAIKDRPGTELVSGVNLAMLVTAFSHRSNLSLIELKEKVIKNGREAVKDVKQMVLARAK